CQNDETPRPHGQLWKAFRSGTERDFLPEPEPAAPTHVLSTAWHLPAWRDAWPTAGLFSATPGNRLHDPQKQKHRTGRETKCDPTEAVPWQLAERRQIAAA